MAKWHPSSEFSIASQSLDGFIKIWNADRGQEIFDVNVGDAAFSMEWNYDGSYLGAITKDKLMHIVDPRKGQSSANVCDAHGGSKSQKLKWAGNTNQIITIGYSDQGLREWAYHDIRRLGQPLVLDVLDQSNSAF